MNAPVLNPVADKKLTTSLRPDEFPPKYAMICDGVCMEPVFMNGSRLVFSRDDRYMPGDYVAIIKRPEFLFPGEHQIIIKKLVLGVTRDYWQPGWINRSGIKPVVIFDALNPHQRYYVDPSKLLGIHKCLGLAPAGQGRRKSMSDEDVRREYSGRPACAV